MNDGKATIKIRYNISETCSATKTGGRVYEGGFRRHVTEKEPRLI